MTTKITKTALGLLATIAAATDSPAGCDYVSLKAPAVVALREAMLIEINEEMKNDAGETAARITDAGRAALSAPEDAAPATAAKPARKSFAIEADVPLVEKSRAPVAEIYPFSALEVGQSFFVANEDVASGNAFSTLNSTVSTANKRFSEPTGEFRPHRRNAAKQVEVVRQLRQFELRHFEQADGTKGARVYRVEVESPTGE